MRYRLWAALLASIGLSHLPVYAQDGKDNVSIVRSHEKQVIEALNRSMTCKPLHAQEGGLYCDARFRGLEINFAGINSPKGRAIYIKAMGPRQILSTAGRRCLRVAFLDCDLRPFPGGTEIIIRDDGVFEGFFGNDEGWARCQ